ncbi:uncharacterized protein LOC143469990 [Clavelina lepadiformis]|uniref:uncharacterized protein LOC143469990 n=1 Tax=Clavelina lepadiformis TaxID=159417 RepID=UPI004041DFCB
MMPTEANTHVTWNSSNQFNKTTLPKLDDQIRAERNASLICAFLGVLVTMYIIVSMVYHGYRTKRLCSCGGKLKKSKSSHIVYGLMLSLSFIMLFCVTLDLALIVSQQEPFCEIFNMMKAVLYSISLFLNYFTLWFRVHSLIYSQPILKKKIAKPVLYINYFTIILLVVVAPMTCVVFNLAPKLRTIPSVGCMSSGRNEHYRTAFISLVVCTFTFQVSLLFCFIYPLHLHKHRMNGHGIDVVSIRRVIKRAVVTAAVCVVTDIATLIFVLMYRNPTTYIIIIVYNFDVIVNTIAVISSSADWKDKFFPWKCCSAGNELEVSRNTT